MICSWLWELKYWDNSSRACGLWFEFSHPGWWKILDIQSNIKDFSFVIYSSNSGGGTQVVYKWSLSENFKFKYLVAGWLVHWGLYSRSKQAGNEFYRVFQVRSFRSGNWRNSWRRWSVTTVKSAGIRRSPTARPANCWKCQRPRHSAGPIILNWRRVSGFRIGTFWKILCGPNDKWN